MKSILLSIKPKYCELIANGKKTIEVRKTNPKLEPPFKCYIYCTKSNDGLIKGDISTTIDYIAKNSGKVIGEFVCDEIYKYSAEFVESPKDTYEEIRQIWLDNEGDECDAIIATNERDDPNSCEICRKSCLSFDELREYIGVNFHDYPFYGWHIFDLKIYDTPKELGEFYKISTNCHRGIQKNDCDYCFDCQITRSPQSWCYVEEEV